MVSQDRQRIIEANRSLRNIKNELESLLEKGVISDDAFDDIHKLLPTESSLSGAVTAPATRNTLPTPARTVSPPTASPSSAFSNLHLNNNASAAPGPPSYAQTTGSSNGGPPALPGRNPPPAAPGKPILCHAKALYTYAASDARDCSFEKDDRIAVHEYMNADWWMGKNLRTNQEGIFPKNYVEVESSQPSSGYMDEKAAYQPPGQPTYAQPGGGYPQPPPQQNPYNSNVPPMAVANDEGGGKAASQGKKFGKKLGNAAIFGAGATLGGNLVNSIF